MIIDTNIVNEVLMTREELEVIIAKGDAVLIEVDGENAFEIRKGEGDYRYEVTVCFSGQVVCRDECNIKDLASIELTPLQKEQIKDVRIPIECKDNKRINDIVKGLYFIIGDDAADIGVISQAPIENVSILRQVIDIVKSV